ncbi:MAG: hypothetical protein ACREQF_12920 [Candidatus Binataceae bacterium]
MNDTTARWIPPVLWILAALTLFNAAAQLFAPSAWFFTLVPGVPETGPFNAHLVQDAGTFNLAIGVGLIAAARDAHRYAIAVVIAAIAAAAHALLHVYAHAANLLSTEHIWVEFFGVLVPAVVLAIATISLLRNARASDRVDSIAA